MKSEVEEYRKLLNPSESLKRAVENYLKISMWTAEIRQEVESYQRKILKENEYEASSDKNFRGREIGIIRDPNNSYLMSDEDFQDYLDKLHAEHKEHGYSVERGECPKLMAEHKERKAKRKVVEEARYATEISYDDLIAKIDKLDPYIEIIVNIVCRAIQDED